jgi:tRNA threonylcarbamoyladenosine biosynthesis protein TsaB
MKEVFGAVYRFESGIRTKVTEDQAASVEFFIAEALKEKGPYLFLGNGAQKYREAILSAGREVFIAPLHCGLPRAEAVAAEALELWMQNPDHDPASAVPRYHRLSQAEQARSQREASEADASASESGSS